jgi:hypothetical protein
MAGTVAVAPVPVPPSELVELHAAIINNPRPKAVARRRFLVNSVSSLAFTCPASVGQSGSPQFTYTNIARTGVRNARTGTGEMVEK